MLVALGLLFTGLIFAGLWDLFSGAQPLVASIALVFVLVGTFNTLGAVNERSQN
jgi:hypothetical protein